MTATGWYPDPDNAGARRYWDGSSWGPPLPAAESSAEDALAQAREHVAGRLEASKRKAASNPSLCVEPDCRQVRAPGGYLCMQHRASVDAYKSAHGTEPAAKPAREPWQTCAVGPCNAQREPGRLYCTAHGPKEPTAWEKRALTTGATTAFAVDTGPRGSAAIVCPHCQTRGQVRTKAVKIKRGISGGKATGALLTAGFSLFATGLSRKETHTECTCRACGMTWLV